MSVRQNAICFFSGTGNSFDVAYRLAKKIQNITLYNIASMDEEAFEDLKYYKRVGIVFPVYWFSMPNIVKNFIKKIPFQKNTYYFCVVTMGAVAIGALYRTTEAVEAAGGHLDYAASVLMPENYILFSRVPSNKMINIHLKNSIKRVETISKDILAYKLKPAKRTIAYRLVQKISEKESEKSKKKVGHFYLTTNCRKCGQCVRLCPVNNIAMDQKKEIIFSDHCECCLLCMHACPAQAINYGAKTIHKKRYINPNINIEDMKKY